MKVWPILEQKFISLVTKQQNKRWKRLHVYETNNDPVVLFCFVHLFLHTLDG